MAGSANVRAVLSTATRSTGNISKTSASQSRHGALAGPDGRADARVWRVFWLEVEDNVIE
jgi:hypothetical protein